MRPHHRRTRQRLAAIARTVFTVSLSGIVVAPVGHADAPAFRRTGTFAYAGPAAADPVARLWYEALIDRNDGKYKFVMRSLDTLKPLGAVTMPSLGVVLRNNVQPFVVNTARGQVYAVYYDGQNAPRIAVVDGRARKIVADFAGLPGAQGGTLRTVYGLGYDARRDALLVASQTESTPIANKAASTELAVSALDGRTGALRWSAPIDACTAFATETGSGDSTIVSASASTGAAYVSCRTGKPQRTSVDAGSSYVVKVTPQTSGSHTVKYFPAPGAPSALAYAPKTERLLLSASTGEQTGVLVFDGIHELFIGFVPGDVKTLGIDTQRGRVYGCESSLLLAADAAIATPIPLGEKHLKLTCDPAGPPSIVDPVRRNLFVKGTGLDGLPVWQILRDESPAYVPEPPENPDEGTVDVAEREGFTESSYTASAAGYGMRSVLVNGPRGAAENFTGPFGYQILNGVSTAIYTITTALGHPTAQGPPHIAYANRELWFGRVAEAKLDDGNTDAVAAAADRNQYVDSDLTALTNPVILGENPNAEREQKWPEKYERRRCQSYGGTTDKPKDEGDGVVVKCELGKSVEADAFSPREAIEVGTLLTVGDSSSSVRLTRDAKLGALSTVVSMARNVVIGPTVRINEIEVTARSWARGRKGTAGSTRTVTFRGVRILGPDGKPVYECGDERSYCNPGDVVAQLNKALGNRLRVRLPQPDEGSLASPGGAKAVIQRSRWEHLEGQTLNGQQSSDTTLPGVEFEFIADNFGQSRLIVQLAGVFTDASYNIRLLPTFGTPPPIPPNDQGGVPQQNGSTGGSGDDGDDTVTKIPGAAGGTTTQTFVEKIRSGVRWVFGWNDGTPLVFVTWAMFGAPVYLGIRRYLLGAALKGGL